MDNISLTLVRPATLAKQATFQTNSDLNVGEYTIPKGSITDGATMPRWLELLALTGLLVVGLSVVQGFVSIAFFLSFWLVFFFKYMIPAFGKYALAATLHDYLLTTGMDRYKADRAMKSVLPIFEIGAFHQFWMYRLVRLQSLIKNKVMG